MRNLAIAFFFTVGAASVSCGNEPTGPATMCPYAHCACNNVGGTNNCICQRGNACVYATTSGTLQCQSTTMCQARCTAGCTIVCDTDADCAIEAAAGATIRCAPNTTCGIQLSAAGTVECMGGECDVEATGAGATVHCSSSGGVNAQCRTRCAGACTAVCDGTSTCTIRCAGDSMPRNFTGMTTCGS